MAYTAQKPPSERSQDMPLAPTAPASPHSKGDAAPPPPPPQESGDRLAMWSWGFWIADLA
jgi:hypothetical protein